MTANDQDWSDFTEAAFRSLIRQLKSLNYAFTPFGQPLGDRQVLWRHDVDVSMHRAARLALLEHEEGVQATYFLNPRCSFYNLAEPEIIRLVRCIKSLGHELGLHFDGGAYTFDVWTGEDLEGAVARERALVEMLIEEPIRLVSWHNPGVYNLEECRAETIAGLVNVYSKTHWREFTYASDSNGIWRYRPMTEVIADGHPRLHLLTHPEWWTPEALSPTERIERSLLGRNAALDNVRPDRRIVARPIAVRADAAGTPDGS